MSRGSDDVIRSGRSIAARSGSTSVRSRAPNTRRSTTSRVSARIRGSVATGSPRGHDASSRSASSATSGACARIVSPCSGGRMSRRWRRCSGPSSSRIDRDPTNGSSAVLEPPRATSAYSVNSRRMRSVSDVSTIGAPVVDTRIVKTSP